MNPISSLPQSPAKPGDTAFAAKVKHAAQDFEAVLLGSLLRDLGQTFGSVPGGDASGSAGSDQYQYLGTEALAAGLAASGGLGVAAMVTRNLLKQQPAEAIPSSADGAKVSPYPGR